MPPDPCRHCGLYESCQFKGLVNRLAIEAFVNDQPAHVCPDYTPDYYKGIEGVFA